MIKVGDTVKVIGKTKVGVEIKEAFPIGTICKVIQVDAHDIDKYPNVYIEPADVSINYDTYWYYESDLEKGNMQWVPEETNYKEILDKLLNHNKFEVRLALAELGYGLDVLVNDVDSAIREEVAKHGRDKDLDILVNDKSWWVRLEVAKHRRSKDLVILVNDEDPKVRNEVLKQKSTIYEDYITDKPTKDEIINELIPSHTDENTKQAFMRRMNITNCRFPFIKK